MKSRGCRRRRTAGGPPWSGRRATARWPDLGTAFFASPGSVLRDPIDRRVDNQPFEVRFGKANQGFHGEPPAPTDAPAQKPRVGALPRPMFCGQVTPRGSGARPPQDGLHDGPVQQRRPLQTCPLIRIRISNAPLLFSGWPFPKKPGSLWVAGEHLPIFARMNWTRMIQGGAVGSVPFEALASAGDFCQFGGA